VPRVRVIVGAHPHNAKDFDGAALARMRALGSEPVTCALGELGLDYHYDHSPREVQRRCFGAHLRMAHEFGLPVVIHLREAHEDGLKILSAEGVPARGAILHCYTLGVDVMRPFLELGCHVSFAGPVSFKKASGIRQAAAEVPEGRILTETDCPFMSPEPFRGKPNEPALVAFTAAKIAEARGESAQSFAEHAFSSATELLGGSDA
jgi:TatD DNase family protein